MAITNGKYKAKATGAVVLGKSSVKGTPFIEFYFQIADGPNQGGKVRWTGYLSDGAAARTIEALQTCGWQGEDLGEFADGELHGLDSSDVQIVVELEEYEDRDTGERRSRPKVQWVNRLSGGALNLQNAMNKDEAGAFGDRMRGLVLKLRQKNPSKGPDLPF